MLKHDLEKTFLPFVDFDSYILSLFTMAHHNLFTSAAVEKVQKEFSGAENALGLMTDARVGSAVKQRAADLKPDELAGFVQAASDLVVSNQEWAAGLKELGFTWNVQSNTLERPESTSAPAAIILIAISVLGSMETVNYKVLHEHSSGSLGKDFAAVSTDWKKNRTPEHIWRRLQWAEQAAGMWWSNPRHIMEKRPVDALRAGHMFAAISHLAQPFIR